LSTTRLQKPFSLRTIFARQLWLIYKYPSTSHETVLVFVHKWRQKMKKIVFKPMTFVYTRRKTCWQTSLASSCQMVKNL